MKIKRGIFIHDLHRPFEINLKPVWNFIRDFKPDWLIYGGDVIDAHDMHGVKTFTLKDIESRVLGRHGYYERDKKLFREVIEQGQDAAPKAKKIFEAGNHCERYDRIAEAYPETYSGKFNLVRDALPKSLAKTIEYIPYGNYDSFYRIGDTLFTHGTLYPDHHSKKYAYFYSPSKVIYAHLHDFQVYTIHRGDPTAPSRFALTAGCLCHLTPEYKKGSPNKWTNGLVSFVVHKGVVIPTPHIINDGVLFAGGEMYD